MPNTCFKPCFSLLSCLNCPTWEGPWAQPARPMMVKVSPLACVCGSRTAPHWSAAQDKCQVPLSPNTCTQTPEHTLFQSDHTCCSGTDVSGLYPSYLWASPWDLSPSEASPVSQPAARHRSRGQGRRVRPGPQGSLLETSSPLGHRLCWTGKGMRDSQLPERT